MRVGFVEGGYIGGTVNLGLGRLQKVHAKYNVCNPIRHYIHGSYGLVALDAKGDGYFLIHNHCTTVREGYI